MKRLWIILAFTILAEAPAGAWVHGSAGLFPAAFTGSPNVTITAINTSAGITKSRATCQLPCFVQVSAGKLDGGGSYDGITATGTSRPFEDLEYVWNFGDIAGSETFTRPTDGTTVNANDGQISPEAAYVYRTVGDKTITLRVRGCASPPAAVGANCTVFTTSAPITTTISVAAFDKSGGEAWADSNASGSTNAGTLANPYNTASAVKSFLGAATSNRQLNIAQGSTFTLTGAANSGFYPWSTAGAGSMTGLRVDSYVGAGGAGDIPMLDISSGAAATLQIDTNNGITNKSDIVFRNIKLARTSATSQAGNAAVGGLAASGTARLADIYFDNVQIDQSSDSGSNQFGLNAKPAGTGNGADRIGFWKTTIAGSLTATTNFNGMFIDIDTNFFFVGGSVQGAGESATFDHHIYVDVKNHGLAQWINFGQGPVRGFCINYNWNNVAPLEYNDFIVMSENSCGTAVNPIQRGFDASNNNNDPSITLIRNFVVQRNAFHDLPGDGAINSYTGQYLTYRDNRVWNSAKWFYPSAHVGNALNSLLYRNKLYYAASAAAGAYGISFVNNAIPGTFTGGGSAVFVTAALNYGTVDQPVVMSGAGLPPEFTAGNTYYIRSINTAGTNFTLAATAGGAAITVAGASAAGVMTQRWTALQTFTYNTIVDARATTARMINLISSPMISAGSVFNYNQYWSTTGATNLFDNVSGVSWAGWQSLGFDANGANSNPGWTTPVTQWSDMN